MKQLIIARHAKSSRDDMLVSDFYRTLNHRGKHDLHTLQKILTAHVEKPDLIVASPAKRTKKTAQAYATARGYKKKHIMYEETLYLASLGQLLKHIESTPEEVNTLVIVGHNPGLTDLINHCGYGLDNLPTCGVVVFQYGGELRGNFEQKKCIFHEIFFPKQEQL